MVNAEHPFQCERIADIATHKAEIKNLRDLFDRMEKSVDEKFGSIMKKLGKIEKNGNGKKGFSFNHAVIIALLGLIANLVFFIVQAKGGGAPPLPLP